MDKFIYIPGFLDTCKNRSMELGLDIWLKDISPKDRIDAEYVIGHSMGGCFALLNWSFNKNTKLILTNPVLTKRSLLAWKWRWIKYVFVTDEKFPKERWKTLMHPCLIIKRYFQLMKIDYGKILKEKPDNIIIFRGKNDNILCDDETGKFIKNCGVKLIEMENTGHDWGYFENEVKKLIN